MGPSTVDDSSIKREVSGVSTVGPVQHYFEVPSRELNSLKLFYTQMYTHMHTTDVPASGLYFGVYEGLLRALTPAGKRFVTFIFQ